MIEENFLKGQIEFQIWKNGKLKNSIKGNNFISQEFKNWYLRLRLAEILGYKTHPKFQEREYLLKRVTFTRANTKLDESHLYAQGEMIYSKITDSNYSGNDASKKISAKYPSDYRRTTIIQEVSSYYNLVEAEGEFNTVYISLNEPDTILDDALSKKGNYNKAAWLIPFEDGYLTRDFDKEDHVQKLNSNMECIGESIKSAKEVVSTSAIWHNDALYGISDNKLYKIDKLSKTEAEEIPLDIDSSISSEWQEIKYLVKVNGRIFLLLIDEASNKDCILVELDKDFNLLKIILKLDSSKMDFKPENLLWFDESEKILGNQLFSYNLKNGEVGKGGSNQGSGLVTEGVVFLDAKGKLKWRPTINFISCFQLPETVALKEDEDYFLVYHYIYDKECMYPFKNGSIEL